MSYVVEVLRPIQKDEVLALVRADVELAILSEGDNWLDFSWNRGDESATFNFMQGRISITTPVKGAWDKAQTFAAQLGATVIGEEDDLPIPAKVGEHRARGSVIWIGWPLMVVVLTGLLIWKW